VEVAAGEVERLARQRAAEHGEELVGAVVALVVVEPVPEAALLGLLAATDDVQQQAVAGDPLVRRGLLGGERRHDDVRAEGDEEAQPRRVPEQGGGGDPGVLAPRPGRREDAGEAEVLGGARDLGEVLDPWRTTVAVRAHRDHGPAVSGGRQEPVQRDARHRRAAYPVILIGLVENLLGIVDRRDRESRAPRTDRGDGLMARYLARRLGQAVFVLWAAFTVSFVILYALPSDPVAIMSGGDATDIPPAMLDALRHEYGLDQPLWRQYLGQLGDVLHGDLGRSVQNHRPVTELIREALPATIQIAGAGLALAIVGGGTLALVATFTRRRWLQQTLLSLPPLGVAVPSFWVGLLLLQQFSFHWTWFPAVGNEGWRSIVLPAITLALPTGAQIAQLLAKSMQHTLDEPYIDTARSKGASRTRVHVRHALRNAALPALTMSGLLVGALLAGTVVTETVFSRTGLGRLTSASVAAQDIPVVQGLVLFGAAVFVIVNLAVDLLYPLLDPRIGRVGSRRRRARNQFVEVAA
jgi:peptide/nickel transport system permease protein